MKTNLIFNYMLNFLKKRNDNMLYEYFLRHNRHRVTDNFKAPSKMLSIRNITKKPKDKSRTKRSKVFLKTEFTFTKHLVSNSKRKHGWSWNNHDFSVKSVALS